MGDVVKLQSHDGVWLCNCDCTVHYHHSNGSVECAACGAMANGLTGEWRLHLPDTPDQMKEVPDTAFKVVHLDNATTYLKRQIKETGGAIAAVVLVYGDGRVSTYSEADAEEVSLTASIGEGLRMIQQRLRS